MLTAAGEVAPCAQHCSGMSAVAGPVTHCKEAALESPPIWERFSSKLVLVKKENNARVVKNNDFVQPIQLVRRNFLAAVSPLHLLKNVGSSGSDLRAHVLKDLGCK